MTRVSAHINDEYSSSMNHVSSDIQTTTTPHSSDEIALMDILIAMAKHKKMLVAVPVVAALISAAATFFMPNVYQATARLMPPQQAQSAAVGLMAQLGSIGSLATGLSGLKNPNDLYVAMLNSRTIADKLIAKYDLKRVYEVDSLEKTRKALAGDTHISAGKDGLITINVESTDKTLVAKLANGYISELSALTRVLAVGEASQRRLFFERQLQGAKNDLARAEIALKSGLDERGVVSVDSESRAIVETIARVRAQVSAKEIQLRSMQAFVTPTNPAYRKAEEELFSLRDQLSKLENGRGGAAAGDGATPVGNTPGKAGLQNIQALRDVKYYQMLYEILAKQYEAARLDEAKDFANIQVLDAAIDPERKAKPKRTFIVLGVGVAAFVLTLLYITVGVIKEKALALPERASRWAEFKRHLGFSRK
ncbi:lipopolysaccharide biosynthesis protein [Massilia sp. JS1662]|nr:lipopolysaccharide biosynthesis protein [Massilia sp. JS1662]